jgi:hypothetical protein
MSYCLTLPPLQAPTEPYAEGINEIARDLTLNIQKERISPGCHKEIRQCRRFIATGIEVCCNPIPEGENSMCYRDRADFHILQDLKRGRIPDDALGG